MNAISSPAAPSTGITLSDLPSALRPLDDTAFEEIARSLSQAAVVGIGESTRFAQETFEVRDRLFRILVQQYGFRAVALQDSADVAAVLDHFVLTGEGTAQAALDTAWRPWRTAETAAALEWIRDFNREHGADPVRIIAVKPAQANSADYDVVLDAVRRIAPDRLAEISAHLEPIRSAHTTDEHVQRARGIHPGRAFQEDARDAAALLNSLAGVPEDVRSRLRLIVDFHERSVAGRGSFVGDDDLWGAAMIDYQTRTGRRIVYWDGIAHSSALATGSGDHPTAGSVLRQHYGARYASVAIGFHHGDLGIVDVPAPPADFLDAVLGVAEPAAHWVDLRGHHGALGPVKMRVISGIYDPANDAAAHLVFADLPAAFDVLVHVREASALRWLP
ncbi:erythromycin esterase family protein [Nocardia sp. NPDC006630]|uniref:erythromycin esterase family protein n=1 Tax=Nocardia sp. NPDC006630 TaxID=3157181 RepID=UPI0033BC7F61